MWTGIENNNINSTHLYFEKIMFESGKHNCVFTTDRDSEYVYVIIDGRAHSCRLLDSFHAAFYNDKYVSKTDTENFFSKYNICYTEKSEYLDWFREHSFPDSDKKVLYHFYINSEDYAVEFITDEMPEISLIKA